jgi:DNA-binding NtrC family response regulator
MNPISIILVEDDTNLRQSIALILQRAGYLVTATDCVQKAIELTQSGIYKLIISDINVPATRTVLLPKVLDTNPHLAIVILTDQRTRETCGEDGLLDTYYLVKPVAPELLLDCLWKIMGSQTASIQKEKDRSLVNPDLDYQ